MCILGSVHARNFSMLNGFPVGSRPVGNVGHFGDVRDKYVQRYGIR